MNKISFKLWKSNLEKKPDLEKNQDSTQLNIIASANMFLKDKWESILEKGMISNSSFIKECISIEKEKGENILSTGLSKLQMTFRNLFFFKNDKTQNPQLKNAFNDFISELQNGYYLDYFQIEDGIKICDTLLQNKALPPNYTENYFIDLLDKFLSIHSTEIKAIWRNSLHHNSDDIKSNIIKSKLIEIHHVAENNQSLEIEKKLSHKPEFEKIINDGNYYLYDGIALISHMDIDTLYSWLINDNNLHNSFLYFLSERYFLDSATVFPNIYLSDYTNLNTLYFKVKAECIAKEHSFDCSVLVLNDFITHYQKILKSMDKAKKEIKIIPVPIEK